jgi:hypothetical protein
MIRHLCILVALAVTSAASAECRIYPAPQGAGLSDDYTVTVNGKAVDVYRGTVWEPQKLDWGKGIPSFGGPYSFAYFDFSGSVEVAVTSHRQPLDAVKILPLSGGITPAVKGNALSFVLKNAPCQLSIEPNGKNGPLILFANPPERNAPTPGSANVKYYGPGVHEAGKIELRSNETLYLAGGAVLKGGIEARGANIRVMGRGIIDGLKWERFKGPARNILLLDDCSAVEVDGIIVKDGWGWSVNLRGGSDITLRNVKVIGSRCENNDGIDICNSQRVTVEDCFVRTDDDCIAIKGKGYGNAQAVDGVTVKRCVLWTDRANIWRVGCESRAAAMRNILSSDIEVVHHAALDVGYVWKDANWVITLQPGEDMPMENVRFENIRIHQEGQGRLIQVEPLFTQWNRTKTPGRIRDCSFKNITVYGTPKSPDELGTIRVHGPDNSHDVRNVKFENVVRFGQLTAERSSGVDVSGSCDGVVFAGPRGNPAPPKGGLR